MSRPAGVTVSAVIGILGSLGTLAFAGFMILGAVTLARSPQLTPPGPGLHHATRINCRSRVLFRPFGFPLRKTEGVSCSELIQNLRR